jgi:hypothetical protein
MARGMTAKWLIAIANQDNATQSIVKDDRGVDPIIAITAASKNRRRDTLPSMVGAHSLVICIMMGTNFSRPRRLKRKGDWKKKNHTVVPTVKPVRRKSADTTIVLIVSVMMMTMIDDTCVLSVTNRLDAKCGRVGVKISCANEVHRVRVTSVPSMRKVGGRTEAGSLCQLPPNKGLIDILMMFDRLVGHFHFCSGVKTVPLKRVLSVYGTTHSVIDTVVYCIYKALYCTSKALYCISKADQWVAFH